MPCNKTSKTNGLLMNLQQENTNEKRVRIYFVKKET